MIQNSKIWDEQSELKGFCTPNRADIMKIYNIDKSASILDLGCGYGRTLNNLWEMGYANLTGIDYSRGMLYETKNTNNHINLYEGSIPNNLPKIGKFDVIYFLTVANSIISDGDLFLTFKYIFNSLNPEGYLVFDDYIFSNNNEYRKRYIKALNEFDTYGIFRSNHNEIFRHRPKCVFDNLLKTYFTIENHEICQVKSMNNRNTKLIHYICKQK